METNNTNSGLSYFLTGHNVTQQPWHLWRPWTGIENTTDAQKVQSIHTDLSAANKPHQFIHPVKLFWPKSRCFDYLYQDAEMLLRNYPVQATICFYGDSSSEDDEDDDDDDDDDENSEEGDEDMEKERN